jgi:serine/threonine-protein kinase
VPGGAVSTARNPANPTKGSAGPSRSAGTTTTAPPPAEVDEPDGARLTSEGGTVYAVCATLTATLTGWDPAPGFDVEAVDPGPAIAPMIVFAADDERYRTTVTCVAGEPTTVVLPL